MTTSNINIAYAHASPSRTQQDLAVSFPVPNRVVVSKGSVLYRGKTYTLASDEYFDVTVEPYQQDITAYLVSDKSGAVHVLFDAYAADDGHGVPYAWAGSPYLMLFQLMEAWVPAGTNSIATSKVNLFKVVEKVPTPAESPLQKLLKKLGQESETKVAP